MGAYEEVVNRCSTPAGWPNKEKARHNVRASWVDVFLSKTTSSTELLAGIETALATKKDAP
jgi:hypothetical protein